MFPATDVTATWNLWHFGYVSDRIKPLRHQKKWDLDGTAKQTALWSKSCAVMSEIVRVMVEDDMAMTVDDVRRWD